MSEYYCPKCGSKMVRASKVYCEYQKRKYDVLSGCGVRVPYNKTWRFCPICGRPICKMEWGVKDD